MTLKAMIDQISFEGNHQTMRNILSCWLTFNHFDFQDICTKAMLWNTIFLWAKETNQFDWDNLLTHKKQFSESLKKKF